MQHYDAAGRPIYVGDIIGGTATQPYAATIVGKVVALDGGGAIVDVPVDGATPRASGRWDIALGRCFYVGRALEEPLQLIGEQLGQCGPALFFIADTDSDMLTVTRVDQAAVPDPHERAVAKALIGHAIDVLLLDLTGTGYAGGPTLVYVASDRVTAVHVDQRNVKHPREHGLCLALLRYAFDLCTGVESAEDGVAAETTEVPRP